MKKTFRAFISCVLIMAMFATLVVFVSAEQATDEKMIMLDIVWDDISFVYDEGTSSWNPSNHSYSVEQVPPGWSDNSGKITITNHSEAAVSVKVEFEPTEEPNGSAVLVVDNPEFTLDSSAFGDFEKSSTITAEGVPDKAGDIGKIVVTVIAFFEYYEREGNIIYLGEYPQTLKASSVTVSDTPNSKGYFLGSDNEYYAKVVATPYESGYKFSTDATVTSGTEYYFKVEPLKWRVLSEKDGNALIFCESIIDNRCYDSDSNNYEQSDIRAWLNGEFYNLAFSENEKKLIQTVPVSNSLATTGYSANSNVCADTNDKVYLLSYQDVINNDYGFDDDTRVKSVSDYAKAHGAWVSKSNMTGHSGNGMWMLRSPNDTYTHFIRECNYNGEVTDGGTHVNSSFYGVVPALTIKA